MAINKNHEFEDLDGVKCAVVEKNASKERVAFLKDLLEFNRYKVIVVPSPPPKAVPPASGTPKPVEGQVPVEAPAPPPAPETFTVGVTDVTFNATNAIFGRLLKTKDKHVVTLAYWQQEETTSSDHIPYFSADENSHQWK
ncbi:hypothetical protein [Lacibacter sediminis]|uniref:Uncharacterized protein n=1 Tax=Lacibacter sediminis TaxID=2760713 RepID=A0A7G5XE56_9BACT|nr:hypothetical protein [Lacibacter sediminis]QNA43759.1 hypothetical protein H4075_16995 [Lacibacter sediminis]